MKNVLLYAGSQLGVGLYMFLVGTTLQLDHFQSKAKSAVGGVGGRHCGRPSSWPPDHALFC